MRYLLYSSTFHCPFEVRLCQEELTIGEDVHTLVWCCLLPSCFATKPKYCFRALRSAMRRNRPSRTPSRNLDRRPDTCHVTMLTFLLSRFQIAHPASSGAQLFQLPVDTTLHLCDYYLGPPHHLVAVGGLPQPSTQCNYLRVPGYTSVMEDETQTCALRETLAVLERARNQESVIRYCTHRNI
ncbi:hypothetical protein AG1IA_09067 [Rhizoctonia solani AG-1 IA]|uniref:Uncharacterized protein n=1 Tax=Thanatephorus cucumeris (strain AG1-IA) TaxID=983506 RepID=L8WJB2_THACA|nr:hypothetical protein AG1IA_09067 [Rhizoctonia solani AG-1 IA]